MIKCTTYISNKLASILIDHGATFSFISSTFVIHTKLKLSSRNEPVVISTPMRMSIIWEIIVKDISVRIGEDEMKWDFMPLPLSEFNVILSMDGLSQYRANVNCYKKWVVFEKKMVEKYILRERVGRCLLRLFQL